MRPTESTHFVEEMVNQIENENNVKNVSQIRTRISIPDDNNPIIPTTLSVSSQVQLDRSTYHSASQEVLEVKTMLLQLRRVLEQVEDGDSKDKLEYETNEDKCEIHILKNQVLELQHEMKIKERKIKELEEKLANKKHNEVPRQTISTQTSGRMVPTVLTQVSRPHSMQDVSNGKGYAPLPRSKTPTNSSMSTKRCHHSWGPCPKDFTHHSSRSTSMERTTRRSGSPWGYSSSSSSGGSPVVRKIRLRSSKVSDEDGRYERANSLDHLNNSSTQYLTRTTGHKLCIYVQHE
eukprot:GFUD01078809.1.p1 GENE.GFUD01078809.1~~GFUD01078809.1.p1  ORF type:complete len:291 (+),score=87.21 GFUD01078809.1:120-992(+)